MQRLSAVSAVVAAAILSLVAPATSMAQRDNLDFKAVCECHCMVEGGNHVAAFLQYDAPLGGCGALEGKTCNREALDPVSGVRIIRSGRLWGCALEEVAAESVGSRAEALAPVEPQQMTPSPLFNRQLILQTPTVEPGKKPMKLKPVAPLGGITTSPQ